MVEILEGARVRLGVRIDDEDAKGFARVRDLVSYIERRLGFETRRSAP
jgi:acyl carrier protein